MSKKRKRRTANQISGTFSGNKLKMLLSDWVINDIKEDFGLDYIAMTTVYVEPNMQEIEGGSFYIQLKSTINVRAALPGEDLDIEDWELYLEQHIPVIVVKYVYE